MLRYIWGLISNDDAKLTGAKLTVLLLPLSQILPDIRVAFLVHVVWQLETVASLLLASNDMHQSSWLLAQRLLIRAWRDKHSGTA